MTSVHSTNPRNYTVVVNNGVTRSENLSGLMSFAVNEEDAKMAWPELLADEVNRISTKDQEEANSLEECYKKVCKVYNSWCLDTNYLPFNFTKKTFKVDNSRLCL